MWADHLSITDSVMRVEIIVALITSVFASTGLWSLISWAIQRKAQKKDDLTRLILGLGHDRIIHLCVKYIKRGYITKDEYEDLMKYLFDPYTKLGGNGTAERLITEVKSLPIREGSYE